MARERELGSVTNFYVTPTTRLEFLVGKQVPYIAIAFANFLLLTAMTVLIFDVPLKGDPIPLALGAFRLHERGIGISHEVVRFW